MNYTSKEARQQFRESHSEVYERLYGGKPEAIAVLSGGITRKKGNVFRGQQGTYQSESYAGVDDKGFLSGGKARVLAAVEIANVFPDLPIVTLSKTAEFEKSHAEVIAEEMQKKGIAKERFITIEPSYDTLKSFWSCSN